MLSFPPHCSHKLQPLDRTVYGPFKKYYNNALKDLMINSTAHRPDIYDIPELVAKAYKRAMNIENITAGFRVTGIWPHNSNVFTEDEFLPSQVTDRPGDELVATMIDSDTVNPTSFNNLESLGLIHSQLDNVCKPSGSSSQSNCVVLSSNSSSSVLVNIKTFTLEENTSSQSNYTVETSKNTHCNENFTNFKPEAIRPYPVAPPRKLKGKHPRLGKTRVLTDTPVKNEIAERQKKRRQRKQKKVKCEIKCHKRLQYLSNTGKKHNGNDDALCLYCCSPWSCSTSGEFWIRCQGKCQEWAHTSCAGITEKEKNFFCERCRL